jgi:hypothetical protein
VAETSIDLSNIKGRKVSPSGRAEHNARQSRRTEVRQER